MVHLAPLGYVYSDTLSPLGQKVVMGPYRHPKITICGIHLTEDTVRTRSTVMDHAHPESCRECLRGLPSQTTDKVQPVLL
jgi:hypothetical protein